MPTRPIELSNLRILGATTIVTVTVVAWGVLVFAAIEFGRTAREGSRSDWLYLVLATVGAVACMFGAIVMAARLQALMRVAQRSSTRPLAQPLEPLPRPDQPRAQVLESRFTAANVGRSPLASSASSPAQSPAPPASNGTADDGASVARRTIGGKRAIRGYRG